MFEHRFDLRENSNAKFIQSPSATTSDAHEHLLPFTTSRRKYLTLDTRLIDEDTQHIWIRDLAKDKSILEKKANIRWKDD